MNESPESTEQALSDRYARIRTDSTPRHSRFHRPTFGGSGMSTRIGINGFHSGVHVELLPQL
jgi:hypothetical protein